MNTVNYISHELRNKKDDLNNLLNFLHNISAQHEFNISVSDAYTKASELMIQLYEIEEQLYKQIADKIKED